MTADLTNNFGAETMTLLVCGQERVPMNGAVA